MTQSKPNPSSLKEVESNNKDFSRFIRLYKFVSTQKMPKVGAHVYLVSSYHGTRIDSCVYIVDEVVQPGFIIGRQLLQSGKEYGKPRCLNMYCYVETDENELISNLIDQKYDYMKEQKDKNNEKRRLIAKINRYNKKISHDTRAWGGKEYASFFNDVKIGDYIYFGSSLLHIKRNKMEIAHINHDKKYITLQYHMTSLQTNISIDPTMPAQRRGYRFITKEVPVGFQDFSIV